MIERISVAPEIPPDEAELIANMYSDMALGKLPLPKYPTKHAEEWQRVQIFLAGGPPLTMGDTPAGLFPDLDS
jgi:hypothetical protein